MTNHEFLRIFPEKFNRRTTMQCTRAGWVVTRECQLLGGKLSTRIFQVEAAVTA
jgi:hypothetical protein